MDCWPAANDVSICCWGVWQVANRGIREEKARRKTKKVVDVFFPGCMVSEQQYQREGGKGGRKKELHRGHGGKRTEDTETSLPAMDSGVKAGEPKTQTQIRRPGHPMTGEERNRTEKATG
jgi:hypothetical protein